MPDGEGIPISSSKGKATTPVNGMTARRSRKSSMAAVIVCLIVALRGRYTFDKIASSMPACCFNKAMEQSSGSCNVTEHGMDDDAPSVDVCCKSSWARLPPGEYTLFARDT